MEPTPKALSEWVKLFPSQVTENYFNSVTYIKQMTVVAVSTITYLKNMFPEDNYRVESFEGIKLRILKQRCRNEVAQFLCEALIQAFEAFDRKYLDQLALCFYANEHKVENLIEYHIFEYSYRDDAMIMNIRSKNRDSGKRAAYSFNCLRERTVHMIRACVVLMESCLNDVPSTYKICLRLYYNEHAPLDYQAPGYLSANDDDDPLDSTLVDTIKLGWVETPYHSLIARSYFKDIIKASREGLPSQNPSAITQPVIPSTNVTSGVTPATSAIELPLRCPCNKYGGREIGPPSLLVCEYCNTCQHAICFGVLREQAALVSRHCCATCYDADTSRRPTDVKFISLTVKQRASLCIYRRALELCAHVSTIDVPGLVGMLAISEDNVYKLIKLLNHEGIIEWDPAHKFIKSHKIEANRLKYVISQYFQNIGEEFDMVPLKDRFAFRESQSQSISRSLHPLIKNVNEICLQNSPSVEQVPGNIVKESTNTDDLFVNQCRQAILAKTNSRKTYGIKNLPRINRSRNVTRKKGKDIKEYGSCLQSGVMVKKANAMCK